LARGAAKDNINISSAYIGSLTNIIGCQRRYGLWDYRTIGKIVRVNSRMDWIDLYGRHHVETSLLKA